MAIDSTLLLTAGSFVASMVLNKAADVVIENNRILSEGNGTGILAFHAVDATSDLQLIEQLLRLLASAHLADKKHHIDDHKRHHDGDKG